LATRDEPCISVLPSSVRMRTRRQQGPDLKSTGTGVFLKDSNMLAALNIGPTATLELVPRARSRRKWFILPKACGKCSRRQV